MAAQARELHDLSLAIEEAVGKIQRSVETRNEDVDGILVQAELLLRDVLMVEGLLQPAQIGEMLEEAIADVVRSVQHVVDESRHQHIRGRPQIEISEEQLAALLELHFSNRDIA